MLSSALCAYAAVSHQFWLLVAATVLAGYYNANAGLYRFAATEIVAPAFKERAISWVLAGGILGAVAGPTLASAARDALPVPFAGAYAALVGIALLALLTISFDRLSAAAAAERGAAGPAAARDRAPAGVHRRGAACALGYGVMNLLMAATPIAMAQCRHPFASAALVLEWHVLGMFVPSFFTGSLIRRFGCLPVMGAGVVLIAVCIAVALSGVELMQFVVALLTLGVGWNFLFIGGTTLFTQAYRPEEKTTAQAAMDTTIFSTMTLDLVQLRRARHDQRLDDAEPRVARPGDGRRAGAVLACVAAPRCADRTCLLRTDRTGSLDRLVLRGQRRGSSGVPTNGGRGPVCASRAQPVEAAPRGVVRVPAPGRHGPTRRRDRSGTAGTRSTGRPAALSRRPGRSGTAGTRSARSIGTRRDSFRRIAPGSFMSGLST